MAQLKRLGIGELDGLLIEHVKQGTGLPCYDSPDGKESPFYSVEIVKTEPQDTKTMFVDSCEVWVHCISKPTRPYSNAPVLRLVSRLEEAMTEDIALPGPYELVSQDYEGLQALKGDESGEGHAVLSYTIRVCYGFRVK